MQERLDHHVGLRREGSIPVGPPVTGDGDVGVGRRGRGVVGSGVGLGFLFSSVPFVRNFLRIGDVMTLTGCDVPVWSCLSRGSPAPRLDGV